MSPIHLRRWRNLRALPAMLGRRKLAVKVVDIFGNDTMTIVEVGK